MSDGPRMVTSVAAMTALSAGLRAGGETVALVPTMGWLHEGHLSLVREAARRASAVVVSVFVNPTQFGPGEDFERYPRDLGRDSRLAAEAGAGVVFAPGAAEMYPEGFQTHVEVERVSQHLCGARRPGHFRGVATVVAKLLGIVRPDVAVFGRKDWQQLVIIRRLVADLNMGVEIVGCPIVREPDGLAMSSRNTYLSPEERGRALCLSRALSAGRAAIAGGERDAEAVRALMRRVIAETGGADADYVSVCDPESLVELERTAPRALLALAVRIGSARLIDNDLIEEG